MSTRKNSTNHTQQGFTNRLFISQGNNFNKERFEMLKAMANKHNAKSFLLMLNPQEAQSNIVFGYVLFLAQREGIEPKLTGVDRMAHNFTRLAGEPAKSDMFDNYVVALSRHKILDASDVVSLTAAHMAESAQ